MSNNENRNQLTKQQQLDLLVAASPYHIDSVITTIQLNLPYSETKYIVDTCIEISNSVSKISSKDKESIVKLLNNYKFPSQTLQKLIKNGIPMWWIEYKCCHYLKDGLLSLKDLDVIADFQLKNRNICSNSNYESTLDLICSLLKNGISLDSIAKKFQPNFDEGKMSELLLETKLNLAQKAGKITAKQKSCILSIKHVGPSIFIWTNIARILVALDNDCSFEYLEIIAKSKHFAYRYLESMVNSGCSKRDIRFVADAEYESNMKLRYKAFVTAKLTYDQVVCLENQHALSDKVIDFLAKSCSEE